MGLSQQQQPLLLIHLLTQEENGFVGELQEKLQLRLGNPAPNLAVTNPPYALVYDNTPLTVSKGDTDVEYTHTVIAGNGIDLTPGVNTATLSLTHITARDTAEIDVQYANETNI